jgi:opacity protein-like surface antigen
MGALAIGVAPAIAQSESPWMGTVYVGYSKIMENSDEALYGVPGGGVAFHGNVFRMFDPVIGLGAEVGYQHYGEEAYVYQDTPGQDGDAGFSSVHFTAQAIARGTRGKIRPFGTLGLGYYSLRLTASGQLLDADGTPIPANYFEQTNSKGKFGMNLGGGVQFKLSESAVSFGVEARWHAIFDAWPAADGSTQGMDVMTLMAGVHFK